MHGLIFIACYADYNLVLYVPQLWDFLEASWIRLSRELNCSTSLTLVNSRITLAVVIELLRKEYCGQD